MNNIQLKPALILFSGGQDSTTALFWAKQYYHPIIALFIRYGQRHAVEREQSRRIAQIAAVEWAELEIDFLRTLGGNALTDWEQTIEWEDGEKYPNTFVPGRNLLFLNLAGVYAYHRKIDTLVTGFCQADYSGYPDCREAFIAAAEKALQLAMDYPLQIVSPILRLTKAQTWLLARDIGCLDVVIEYSHTCYLGVRNLVFEWGAGCGSCPACLLRKKGFEESGLNKERGTKKTY